MPSAPAPRMRSWVNAHPGWTAALAATLALVVGIGIGAVGPQGEVDDLETEVTQLKDRVEEAEADAADARDALEKREDALSRREGDLGRRERAQRRRLARERREQRDALAEQQQDLEARESEVSAAEQAQEQNKITEGIWQLGRDYEAGLYRSPGGESCYWAKLNSGDTSDIIDNGGFSDNQTLQIDSPFFESNDCGDWVKIG